MKIAVVGATGMVGQVMLQVLREENFPVSELIPVASEKSVGKTVEYAGKEYAVVDLQTAVDMKPAIALFSAGGETSLEWAPKCSCWHNGYRQFIGMENGCNKKIDCSRNQRRSTYKRR